jgi:hypothetical protein
MHASAKFLMDVMQQSVAVTVNHMKLFQNCVKIVRQPDALKDGPSLPSPIKK